MAKMTRFEGSNLVSWVTNRHIPLLIGLSRSIKALLHRVAILAGILDAALQYMSRNVKRAGVALRRSDMLKNEKSCMILVMYRKGN